MLFNHMSSKSESFLFRKQIGEGCWRKLSDKREVLQLEGKFLIQGVGGGKIQPRIFSIPIFGNNFFLMLPCLIPHRCECKERQIASCNVVVGFSLISRRLSKREGETGPNECPDQGT
jgi:hypothetical protein